ncbi:entry exclusion protein [Phyllobacterium brassicacearum]|uniref:Entry exclusion protein n=2 Tax=Phyllobacterium brassicacearum TaxID=314235 RepID=A0A2P7BUQ6_9HYPH|nr:entry exclusion protein [Phyllobacterium brassicacearum]TDQ33998.1 hypothetical protein DEV91_104201 [Phyllobacterium brassicacearum]
MTKKADHDATARDVQYFLDNPDERKAVFSKCENNPGELRNAPECQNVREANSKAYLDDIKKAVSK